MMKRKPVKRAAYPLSMRLHEADVAVIDRAAALRGRSRTDFVREAALAAAETTLLEPTLIRMSEAGFASFVDLIEAPAKPVPALVKIFTQEAPWNE